MKFIASVVLSLSLGATCFAQKTPLYKDASQPVEKRVQDLMTRMTLEEKVGQMCQYVGIEHMLETERKFKGKVSANNDANGFYKNLSIEQLKKLTEDGLVGSFLHVVTSKESNELQKLAQKSKLQIPLIIGIDAIHGNGLNAGATIYPTPIGMASSFDTDLVQKSSQETAKEMRASGSHWTFTPNIDVARDPRWGRIGETFGEDTHLVTQMGLATIKGFQGDNFMGKDKVAACAKHLIAGGEPANGTNASPMDVSERTLREVHLPPYKAAIEKANVFTVMAAHNELNGVPCHANSWLMTDIIRKEYGFKGFVVSDWMDVSRIYDLHKVAPSLEDAYFESVMSGLDMNMHGPDFYYGVIKLVKSGRLSEEAVNRACSRILETKFRLGLFENPFVDLKEENKIVFNREHQQTALELAEKSIVLLKNENILPLDFSKYKNILVTGPNANNQSILGDWALEQPDSKVITILEGIQEAASSKNVTFYDYGSDVRSNDMSKVKEAAALAKKSDLAIVVVGENPLRYLKNRTSGENIDRISLDLLGVQEELVKQIHKTGVPTIVVLVGGRPLSVNWIAKNVPALVQAWEPGSFGGKAIANILSGKVNPSAKLPVSIPRSSGQIQMIYNHKPSQYFHNYKDGQSTPLYPFGFGLSYANFSYSDVKLSAASMDAAGSIIASVSIQNTGKVDGDEVVQLYIRDLISSVTRPVKELKGFKRVHIPAGKSVVVDFKITAQELAFWRKDMTFGVEAGNFKIFIGTNSVDVKEAEFSLTESSEVKL